MPYKDPRKRVRDYRCRHEHRESYTTTARTMRAGMIRFGEATPQDFERWDRIAEAAQRKAVQT